MDLPIKFPSDAEVVADEVARFRALSPEQRVRALGEIVRLYHFLASNSARPETVARLAEEEEALGRKAIKEFIARHGGVGRS
jgi:hypothetical protein